MSRLLAGMFAVVFIAFVERSSRASRPRSLHGRVIAALLGLLMLGIAPLPLFAADALVEGTNVRIESEYIEAGWHQGKLSRTPDRCWMVTLTKPTKDGYTMVALRTAKRMQVARAGAWQDTSATANLKDQPRSCLEDGSD
jgi:hypothetical protein